MNDETVNVENWMDVTEEFEEEIFDFVDDILLKDLENEKENGGNYTKKINHTFFEN
ncbi:MAG: hypothetical protein MSH33_09655 [Fusobacterium necrophorum]|nr:hypothetical protein [Fusobacterium necrophorum]